MDIAEQKFDPLMTMSPGRWSRVPSLTFPLAVMALFLTLLIVFGTDASGLAWHEEGQVATREYRDITLTDLEGDGTYEVGGILKEIEDGDPSAEFYRYSDDSWEFMDENISYSGYYNDLEIQGPLVVAGHAGGNSVNSWTYNTLTDEFDFNEPDTASQIRNWSLSVAIGDLNNDTYPDIVAGFKERGLKIFYGNSSGGWEVGNSPKTAGMVKAVLIADMNNDSHLDIINTHKEWEGQPNDPKKIEIYLGDGEGNWSLPKNVVSDKNLDYSTIACAPMNEDEYPDIIAGSDSKEGIDRYIFQPAGSFWERSQVSNKGTFSSLILEDVDGDGIPDITGSRFDDLGVLIYLGNGDGTFDTEDVGPIQIGNIWTSILWDFNEDGHTDILIANRTGLYYWVQALPEIKNVVIPETMYAMHGSYDLSLEVSSEVLMENPDNLEFVRIRYLSEDNISFMLTYNGESGQFYVEEGTDLVTIDNDNSSRSDLGDGRVHINFNIQFKWKIPDMDQVNGSTIQAYMKEEGGSTGWVDLDPGPWHVVSSVTVGDLTLSDPTLNPGDTVAVSGNVYYNGSDITVPDEDIREVVIHADGLNDNTAFDIIDGAFTLNITLPAETGEFQFWPEVVMDRGEPQPIPIPIPWEIVTVHSDYVVVTDIWITGEAYYDFNTLTSWQRSGESVTIHTHAKYQHTGLAYDGEIVLTNGSSSFNTTGRNIELTFDPYRLITQQLVPANDSAFDNDFGPMLRSNVTVIPKAIWDGEAPMLLDFGEGSLVTGSEIKAVDAEISIIVSEAGLMEPFEIRSFGTFTIFWSIIQDENNTLNGSGVMERSWSNQNYSFSYEVPISQAETDNIVIFWFKGNDTVGNQFVSDLWPTRCTEEDPGTILVDPRPPAAPTGLYTSVKDGIIEVRWKPNSEDDLAGYRVYRSTDGENFSVSPISGIDLAPYNYFEDKGLQNGKTYYYRITAVDRAVIPNESNYSEVVSAAPEEDDPEDIMALIIDNILVVFIIAVLIILVMGSMVIVIRNRSDGSDDQEPPASTGSTPPFSPSSMPPAGQQSTTFGAVSSTGSSQYVKQPSVKTPVTTQTPVPSSMEQPADGNRPNFPEVDWKCPSCTHQVKLLQGERFCTNCGYKIR